MHGYLARNLTLLKDVLKLKKAIFFLLDLAIVLAALNLALVLRFDGVVPERHLLTAQRYTPVFVASALIVFYAMQFYRHLWQYASVQQYAWLMTGILVQTILVALIMVVAGSRLPWSVYILYGFITSFLILGNRLIFRQFYRFRKSEQPTLSYPLIQKLFHSGVMVEDSRIKRVLVYGAGEAGFQIIRDLLETPRDKVPVAIIDDNPALHAHKILGVKVYGNRSKLIEAVEVYKVDLIIIAMPSASQETIRDIIDRAKVTGCEIKILPRLSELYDSKVSFSKVREVEITDLLGRDEVNVDLAAIGHYLNDQVVLITGGGGSIGSELCRQVARFKPARLVVFDIYENNAYQLENELQLFYGAHLDLVTLIGSVRDENRLRDVFETYRPTVVFHAAAHKHVPLMETSPAEAVKNNIFGTFNVAKISGEMGVKNFILISTDKAVNPTNVMGATKRMAEILIQQLTRTYPATKYAAVRFGNVLGSNGSVIPLFMNQIRIQQKVTVTHPDITRYFMTIPEAARLVIQAGALAAGGEIFVLDMGEPVKIVDLARNLILLSGLQPDIDIKIEFTGLRPGEKMFEELYLDREKLLKTRHNKIFVLSAITDPQLILDEIADLKKIMHCYAEELDCLYHNVMS